MTQIHTISLNTAVDMRMVVPEFQFGAVVRSVEYNEFAAGKAVNNARAISCFGQRVNLYCFSGLNDVDLFSGISPYIVSNVIGVVGFTRRNLTLVNARAELICHVQNHGYSVSRIQFDDFEKLLLTNARSGDVVVLSGSIPDGVSCNDLNDLIGEFVRRDITVLLDVDPKYLRNVDLRAVRLVKPNMEELEKLTEERPSSVQEIVKIAVKHILSQIVVVSLGKEGAIWIDRDAKEYFHCKTELSEKVDSDPIGCGDAMVGGFALGFALTKNATEILSMGVACGYGNMFVDAPGCVSLEHYQRALLSNKITGPFPF